MAGETTRSPGQYMRGSCFALALWLADRTDYALFGAFDDAGAMHHAFVADPATGIAYDGRGRTSLAGVLHFRGLPCAGQNVRPAARAEVEDYAAEARNSPWTAFDPSAAEIRRFVQRGGFPPLRRKGTAAAA